MNRLKTNRESLDVAARLRRWFSPAVFSLERALFPILRTEATGDVLDAGCGAMPYRDEVSGAVTSYDGADIAPRAEAVRYQCSVTDMHPVASASYDTILCSEVLEHVDRPAEAVAEFARVIRPGGAMIISVPFLGRLHEEPNDFQRYTEHGLRLLLTEAGFDVTSIEATGSIGSFVGHQISSAIVLPTWHIPFVGWITFGLNVAFVVVPSLMVDFILKPFWRKLPLGYVVIASKA